MEGSLYYFPFENGCETLPAAEEAKAKHHVHTFDLTQRPMSTQARANIHLRPIKIALENPILDTG